MIANWTDQDFSHGWLIPLISMWLVYSHPEPVRKNLAPSWIGLWIIFLSSFIMLAGFFTATQIVMQTAAVLATIGACLAYFGVGISKQFWFPIGFLIFMLPIGTNFIPSLTNWTADFLEIALKITNIPAYREEADFVLPTGRWSVIAACSGLRYLVASVMLSTLFAYLNFRTAWKGILFILIATICSIVANWIRAYITVVTGHITEMRFGPGVEHLWLGWILFGIVMITLCWGALKFNENSPSINDKDLELRKTTFEQINTFTRIKGLTPICGLISVICAGLLFVTQKTDLFPINVNLAQNLDKEFSGITKDKIEYLRPNIGASSVVNKQLRDSDISYRVSYFANQPQLGAMISMSNSILPDEEETDWRLASQRILLFEGARPGLKDIVVRKRGRTVRVISWFAINGVATPFGITGKIETLKKIASGKG
ncbi:MAG: exosortase, partial [Actinobacteria bacterium]|nr:exosortase [Actinomycetota bacterium]